MTHGCFTTDTSINLLPLPWMPIPWILTALLLLPRQLPQSRLNNPTQAQAPRGHLPTTTTTPPQIIPTTTPTPTPTTMPMALALFALQQSASQLVSPSSQQLWATSLLRHTSWQGLLPSLSSGGTSCSLSPIRMLLLNNPRTPNLPRIPRMSSSLNHKNSPPSSNPQTQVHTHSHQGKPK